MKRSDGLLLVSNYASDTAYAWWLMEHFWFTLAGHALGRSQKVFIAFPRITRLSDKIISSGVTPVEFVVPDRPGIENEKLKKFIRKENVRYVYLTDRKYFNPIYLGWRLAGVKRIVVHDHTPGDRPVIDGIRGRLKTFRNHINWFCSDAVFCVSPLMRDRSIQNSRVPPAKCFTVQNGIVPLPDRNRLTRRRVRAGLGITEGQLLVITTGRIHPYKRLDFLVECARYVRENAEDSKIVFLIVGDGPDSGRIADMIRRYRLDASIRMIGFKTNVADYLAAADAALHASMGEGFSLSILEYMSAGLATLVPNIPSVSQAIEHNRNGYIYQWDSAESAASILLRLNGHPVELLDVGAAASSRVKESFCLEKTTRDLLYAWEKVVL